MPSIRRLFSDTRGHARLRLVAVLLALGMLAAIAAPPLWWAERGVTSGQDSDDYAALNQGQLKTLAGAAVAEFDAMLQEGAGPGLHSLVQSWAAPTATTDDYAAVNLGQLKAVAKPFYDRLKTAGDVSAYPWQASPTPPDDYTLANIGQAKALFAFRLASLDVQQTVPDWWVQHWGLKQGGAPFDSAAAAPGGITYQQKFQLDLNPTLADTNGNGADDATDIANGTDPKYAALDLKIAAKWASAAHEKMGFPEYANASDPPKIYLIKTATALTATYANVNIEDKTATVDYTEKYTPATRKRTFDGMGTFVKHGYATSADHRIISSSSETTNYHTIKKAPTKQPQNLVESEQIDYDSEVFPSVETNYADGESVWKTGYEHETGYYLQKTTLQPGPGGPIWMGDGYSANGGHLVLSGDSTYTGYKSWPDFPGTTETMITAINAQGNWSGTWRFNDEDPIAIDHWAFKENWAILDQIGGETEDTPTTRTYVESSQEGDQSFTVTGAETLSQEYTSPALKTDTLTDMPDFPAEWFTVAPFNTVLDGAYGGTRSFSPNETQYVATKVSYQLRANASAPQTILWCEYFRPYDLTKSTMIHQVRQWSKSQTTACESGVFEVIPKDDEENGYYFIGLLPVDFKEVTPLLKDEDGNDIPNSDKPKSIPEANEMVEEPRAGLSPNVAYRILKVKVPEMMSGETIRWTMTPKFTPEGEAQPRFRGQWPTAHPDRFEASDGPTNYYAFNRVSQQVGETIVDGDGETVLRINLPPIGFNKARVKLEFESYPGVFAEIDFEVPAIVVIDPGHGGTTNQPGSDANHAVSPRGALEKNMTLAYALALRASLRAKADQDKLKIKILMTRTLDENPSGATRAAKARDNGADVILIIHFNSSDSHTARGTLEVRRVTGNVNQNEDVGFINRVVDRVVPAIAAYDAGARKRDFVVVNTAVASDQNLANTAAFHPIRAGYIEVEFIDNPAIDMLLNPDLYPIIGANPAAIRQAIVDAMRDGIISDLKRQPTAP